MTFDFSIWWPLWTTWVLQAIFGWYNVWAFRRKMHRQDADLALVPAEEMKPAVVLSPIKGINHVFREYVTGMMSQDYPSYRLLFTVEEEEDPVWKALRESFGMADGEDTWERDRDPEPPIGKPAPGLRSVTVNVAGLGEGMSQKVYNQFSALKRLTPEDEMIASADADMLPGPDWLRRLLAPLQRGTHGVATTYRWLVPVDGRLSEDFASVINGSVATLGGPEWCNLSWGGSFAFSRETMERVGLAEKWHGCLNDDLQLAYNARRAGLRIGFVRSLIRPSPVKYDWRNMLGFGFRQYFQVRVYAPDEWKAAWVITLHYVWASLASWLVLLGGNLAALIPIGLVFVLNQVRATERARVMQEMFSGNTLQKLRRAMWLDRWATLAWFALHFFIINLSGPRKEITWAGTRYRVTGRQQTEVLSRKKGVAA